jgi:hypothetical protein
MKGRPTKVAFFCGRFTLTSPLPEGEGADRWMLKRFADLKVLL